MEEKDKITPKEDIWKEQFYRTCQEIIHQIMSNDNSIYFFRPVDPELDGAPNYYDIVIQPMSIYRVQEKLDNHEYKLPNEFINDVRQIWINAKQYNHPTHPIYKAADMLASKFEVLASSLPQYISEESKNSALQRYVELRLLRYKVNKTLLEKK